MGTAPEIGTAERLLNDVVAGARARAQERVRDLRKRHPGENRRLLAERLVKSGARRAGLGGAATGALSLFSLPVGLPAGIALTLALEAELLLALLELYGFDTAGEAGRFKLYALWAGAGAADAAKSMGLRLGANALGRMIAGSLPARVIARLHPALVRIVLKRLGLGWLPKAMKLWPVLGAPIGYIVDSSALRALGKATIDVLESMPPPDAAVANEDNVVGLH